MFRRLMVLVVAFLGAGTMLTSSALASAPTINVTTTSDMGTGTGDCATTDLDCSLRQAIAAAVSAGGATITLPNGNYNLSQGVLDVDPAAGDTITITGASQSGTVISAGGTFQVFEFASGTVTASNLTVEDGHAPSADGGCIDVAASAIVSLESATVQACSSGMDGGGVSAEGNLYLQYDTLQNDSATDLGGGVAVLTAAGVTATVNALGLSATDDTAASGGGVAYAPVSSATSSLLELSAATINADTATGASGGGGIYATSASNPNFNAGLLDSTINADTATGSGATGGGLQASATSAVAMINVTIAGNQATSSGGDVSRTPAATIDLENSIIANGTAGNGQGDCTAADPVTSAGYNLDDENNCGLDETGDLVNTNPDLGPLQDNGGAITLGGGTLETMALQVGSPAIGAGDGSVCPPIDERGAHKTASDCDMGAYQSAPPVYSSLSAGSLTESGATISADVANPDWVPVTLSVEYGTSSGSYPYSSPANEDVNLAGSALAVNVSGSAPNVPVSFAVGGLQPGTTYYYRVVGTNSRGSVTSSEASFTTPGAPSSTTEAPPKTPPPSNKFAVGKPKVSAIGKLTATLTVSDRGTFTAKASFAVKMKKVVRKHGKRVTKEVTKTYTYGRAKLTVSGAGRHTLRIALAKSAAKELAKLGHAKVTLAISFTPIGGKAASHKPSLTVKRSRKGNYS